MRKDHICLDTNVFIDLFRESRNQAHRLLSAIQPLNCEIHMHIQQLREIVTVLKNRKVKLEKLTPEEDNEAQELLEYLENLEYLLLKDPEYLAEKKLRIGRPGFSDKEEDLLARDAEDTLAPVIIATDHEKFEKEQTDAVIVAYAKRQCAILFSADKKHVEEMVENIQKKELDTIRPLWARREDKGFPKLINWREKRMAGVREEKTPTQRVEAAFEMS